MVKIIEFVAAAMMWIGSCIYIHSVKREHGVKRESTIWAPQIVRDSQRKLPALAIVLSLLMLCVILAIVVYSSYHAVVVMMAVTSLSLVYPHVQTRRWLKRARYHNGELCPQCGYMLKGLPEKYRCPECGKEYDLNHVRFQWQKWMGRAG